jgi:hypothetical protein
VGFESRSASVRRSNSSLYDVVGVRDMLERVPRYLFVLLAVYCGASLIHFVHNAELISEYPNLPVWLTRAKVYLAWFAITFVGIAGILLLKWGFRRLGLLLIAGYAALGFDGLGHYSLAPVSAHTLTMNATIWFEVVAAAGLLTATVALMLSRLRSLSPGN